MTSRGQHVVGLDPVSAPVRILLVEDNPGDARLLRAHLSSSDLEAVLDAAGTLAEAIDAADAVAYDVVFLDLGLPDSQGVETVEALRGAAGRDVPIIVLTGLDDVAVGRRAIRAGAAEFLVKDEITERAVERTVKFVLERERARKIRRAAEERWHQVFDQSPIPKVVSEIDSGRMLEVNEAFTQMFGAHRATVEGASSLELGFWDDADRRRELVARLRSEGGFDAEEAWYRDLEGRRGRMLMSARALELSGEGLAVWTIQDVTERYERERFLSTLLANLPGVVYRCRNDRDWTMEYLAPGVEELTGHTAEQLLGPGEPTYASLIHPDDRERVWREVQEALEASRPFRLEYRIGTSDGTEKWIWEQGTGVEVRREGPATIEGYLFEITEEVEARRAAAEARERMEQTFDTMREAVVIVDAEGDITFANPAAEEIFGLSRSEIESRTYDDQAWYQTDIHGEPIDAAEMPVARVLREGREVRDAELAVERGDGTQVLLSVNAAPLRDESGEAVGVV
ncbi:MAG: PAS domain S-box protein, partial [Gemmatimonadota bacterium]|nr:PAS domain S-box protein [Gemmatimonadota bacterium]